MIIPFVNSDLREISTSTLAYIGDAVYELYARCHVASQCVSKSGMMHKLSVKYVSAVAQAKAVRLLQDELNTTEMSYYKRGRNSNPGSMAKNASPEDYRCATGFETLIGYLFLDNKTERMEFLITKTFALLDNEEWNWEEYASDEFETKD